MPRTRPELFLTSPLACGVDLASPGAVWLPLGPHESLTAHRSCDGGHGPLVWVWAEVFVYDLIFICASFGNFSSQQVPVQCPAMGREGVRAGWKRG